MLCVCVCYEKSSKADTCELTILDCYIYKFASKKYATSLIDKKNKRENREKKTPHLIIHVLNTTLRWESGTARSASAQT